MAVLPRSWEWKPLRSIAHFLVSNVDKVLADDEVSIRLCNYTDVYNNEFITAELEFMRATATEAEVEKFRLAIDDVVITKDSESWDDIGVPALVRETGADLVCGYHLAVLRPQPSAVHGPFLLRCLQAQPVRAQLESAASGVTRFGLTKYEIGRLAIPVPPVPRQRAIADYLDRETARIDALIAAKERTLRLLAEKRRALITRAVTRGAGSDTPLRNSGIPWLGKMPVHWRVTRLKFVGQVQTGLALGKRYHSHALIDYPYLRVANVQDGFLDLSDVKTVSVPEHEADSFLLRAGDLLMNEGGDADKLGRGAIWTGEIAPCLHQNHVFAVRARDISPAWLALWTSSEHAKAYFESRSKQSTNLASISATNLMEMPLLQPPHVEQAAIVEAVHGLMNKIDVVRSATKSTVGLLKERRAALISAAVSGRIDVEAAA